MNECLVWKMKSCFKNEPERRNGSAMKKRHRILVIRVSHRLTIQLRWIVRMWRQNMDPVLNNVPLSSCCHTGGSGGLSECLRNASYTNIQYLTSQITQLRTDGLTLWCSEVLISLGHSLHPNQYFRSPWHGATALSERKSVFSTNLNTSKQKSGPRRDFI